MSNRRISTEGYAKPKKPKKPKTTTSGQPARPYSFRKVRANTALYTPTYDPVSGPRVNQLKPGRGGGTNAVGMGGMFTLAPWQKQKTR